MEHIGKRFPGVVALDDVNLSVGAGEVVALIGENGAGKSTLMRIVGGAITRNDGTVKIDGKPVEINSPREASALGIEFIHQELSVLDNLDVAANIFLRREPTKGGFLKLVDRARIYREADVLVKKLGLDISSRTPLSRLSIAQQQLVEIARAVSAGARMIIMDEPTSSLTLSEKLSAYAELTKPRITFLVVLTAAAGFCMGSASGIDYARLLNTSLGIALLSSGLATLNQYFERDLDRLMRRTQARPLPTGKLLPAEAALFGILLSIVATAYLAILINPLSALLGIATFASYLFVYTPLKTRTTLSTVLGAFPGAMPPLIGWVAASGGITVEAWILFAILFLWQFPHFLAIAWMYRDDYARAGIKMLPVVEPDGRVTAQQIVNYTLLLVPVSLLPSVTGLAGSVYLVSAALLGVGFLYFSARAALARTTWQARQLLLASVIYLPILFGMMVLNR